MQVDLGVLKKREIKKHCTTAHYRWRLSCGYRADCGWHMFGRASIQFIGPVL